MREVILFVLATVLLAVAYITGMLQPIIENDNTGIVWGLVGITLIGTLVSTIKRNILLWLCEYQIPTTLGLLGTVIGIFVATQNLSGTPGPEQFTGAFTALTTTIAGLVCQLWLMIVREFTRGKV